LRYDRATSSVYIVQTADGSDSTSLDADLTGLMTGGEGYAIPQILRVPITPTVKTKLIERMRTSGLLQDRTYAEPQISDVEQLEIGLTFGGASYRHVVYAPGLGGESDPVRAQAVSFAADLFKRSTWERLGAKPTRWRAPRLRLAVTDAADQLTPTMKEALRRWPRADVTVAKVGCRTVRGAQQAALTKMFSTRQSAYWRVGAAVRGVYVRVLLPGEPEPECPQY
jgi:hypothetical protein